MKYGSRVEDTFFWHQKQCFGLLVDGSHYFPEMLRTIHAAESHILIEMYIMESGLVGKQFIDALLQAVLRGVSVQLLLDDYGSQNLLGRDRKRIVEGGIQLVFYNPLHFGLLKGRWLNNLFRTHRKFIVVDGHTAYVGGTGLSDAFIGETAWHDCMLRIQGEVVADWQSLFQSDLEHCIGQTDIPPVRVATCDSSASGRLVISSGGSHLQLKRSLLNRIRRGRQYIWLASAYFIPSAKIRRGLRRAARQGKDVRLLLPGPITDHPSVRYASRRYYARLLRHGVRIFEYQARFMHTKTALIDNWCSIGSSNMDRWNFRWNLEANQEVEDQGLASAVKEMLINDFKQCEEIQYQEWLRRSRFQRMKESLWGRVDRWISQW